MIGIKTALIIALFVLAIGVGITYATSVEISRSVPGSITLNLVPIKVLADIDGNGIIDHQDLLAVTQKLNTRPVGDVREDINRDGIVDVTDMAIIAQFFGQEL